MWWAKVTKTSGANCSAATGFEECAPRSVSFIDAQPLSMLISWWSKTYKHIQICTLTHSLTHTLTHTGEKKNLVKTLSPYFHSSFLHTFIDRAQSLKRHSCNLLSTTHGASLRVNGLRGVASSLKVIQRSATLMCPVTSSYTHSWLPRWSWQLQMRTSVRPPASTHVS